MDVNNRTRMTANKCSWFSAWHSVGHRHKAALRKRKFTSGCSCQIDMRPSAHRHNHNNMYKLRKHSCQPNHQLLNNTEFNSTAAALQYWTKLQQCYKEHAHCARRTAGKYANFCKWNSNAELKGCVQLLR